MSVESVFKSKLARAGAGGMMIAFNILGSGCGNTEQNNRPVLTATPVTENGQKIPDLGLKIDEARFLQTIRNRQFGIITETSDRQKMDCLKPLGDFCIAEATPNFKVALNR